MSDIEAISSPVDTAIVANLAVLAERAGEMRRLCVLAGEAIADGQRHRSLGTLLPLDQLLPECEALLRTLLLLHRAPGIGEHDVLTTVGRGGAP